MTLKHGLSGLMTNIIKNLFCCLMLVGVLTSHAFADEKPTYRVGIENVDYYPMFTKKEERNKTGFLIEVMELFAQKRGVKFEYIHLPITRFAEWYQQDNIDFRLPDNPLWNQNTHNLIYSEGIIKLRSDTVVLKKNQSSPMSNLKVIGSLYGFVPASHWKERVNSGKTKFIYENSMRVLIHMLAKGMTDGLDVNLNVVQHYAKELGYDTDDFVVSSNAPSYQYAYALSSMDHPEIVKDFDDFLINSQNEISLLKQRKSIFDSKQ